MRQMGLIERIEEALESRQTSWLSIILKAEFWIMRIIAYFCLLIYKVPAKRR